MWQFRVNRLFNSYTVEFKTPWTAYWSSTTSWSTETLANEAMRFYVSKLAR